MFWEKYTELCKSVGKAPNVVAEECGVKSTGTVTGWKKGSMPRNKILKRIADYFGVLPSYFYAADDVANYVSSSLSDAMDVSKNEKKNKPVTTLGDGKEENEENLLNSDSLKRLMMLSPEELAKVDAFVQGLLASR